MLIFINNYNAKLKLDLTKLLTQFRISVIIVIEVFMRPCKIFRKPIGIPPSNDGIPIVEGAPYRETIRRSVIACTPPVRTCRRERIG